MSIFYTKKSPIISIKDYLFRLMDKTNFNQSYYILALILFEKVINKNSFFIIKLNFHKLFFISLMISMKFIED